jgi:hypothetical protein
MKYFKQMACVAVVLCAGCSNGSDYSASAPPAPPPGGNTTDFSTFVSAQFLAPALSETAAPADVESTNFSFADDDNVNAFDAVIATAP